MYTCNLPTLAGMQQLSLLSVSTTVKTPTGELSLIVRACTRNPRNCLFSELDSLTAKDYTHELMLILNFIVKFSPSVAISISPLINYNC